VAFLVAVAIAAHVPEVRADDATFADARVLIVEASPVDPDTGLIDVTFDDPDTAQTVHAAVYVRSDLERDADGRVAVEVSRRDPTQVRLANEMRTYLDDIGFYLVPLALPLAAWLLRRRHVGRIERLMRSNASSYAMLAAVEPPRHLRRGWRLCLYPLNAAPGAEPVCTVELVWLPIRPWGAFPVEVKGEPRPFGLVAVRSGDDVFWPRGRALASRAELLRPSTVEATLPVAATVETGSRPPSMASSRALRALMLVAFGAFIWLGSASSWSTEQVLERSQPATATVVGPSGDVTLGGGLAVTYRRGDDVTNAVLSSTSGVPGSDDTIAIRYDTADPSVVWPADQQGPALSADDFLAPIALFAGLGAWVASSFTRHRELGELGSYELLTTGRVSLGAYPGS
jgi:hypothetical protein